MGKRESQYASTQGTRDPQRASLPTAGGRRRQCCVQSSGLLDSLKKALTERGLNAEMDYHLAGEVGTSNTRNGYGRKTVMTDAGTLARWHAGD